MKRLFKIIQEELRNVFINEAELISLQNLPFKNDVEQIGGKIYSVGGAVRDEFLGKESKDLDILITSVPMDKLEDILSNHGRVDAVGKSFGILKFKPAGNKDEIDIAIPRTERATGSGGHKGFEVSSDYQLPIEKDLERRDFTINAIAKDINGNIIDPFNGTKDLQNKIIRIVNPEAFGDDPLRMLRAVQFSSRFGFTIEPKTMELIRQNAGRIKEIAPERILIEFDKIITKGNPSIGAQLLIETGLFQQIFGRPKKVSGLFNNVKDMGEFIYLLSVGSVENPADFYKKTLNGNLNTYKEIQALDLAFNSERSQNIDNPVVARSVAHNMYLYSPISLQSNILPEQIKKASSDLLSGKYPKTIGELAINGNDLMSMGINGIEIGNTLKNMLLNVYSDKVQNSKDDLLKLINRKNDLTKIPEGVELPIKEILYSAVVLDNESRRNLIKAFNKLIPSDWEVIAHHMTINLKELSPEKKGDLNKKVELIVRDYAMNDMVIAVGVTGYESKKTKPHITLAVNRKEGGKPAMSDALTNWKPIGFRLKLYGIVKEIENIT